MGPAKALTIAGSDSGGGAGIQADLKTFQERDVYGMSVLTAVTAQNTIGVQGVFPVSVEGVVEQLRSIGEDLPPQAVKTGMLFSTEIIEAVAHEIKTFNWSTIVIDPVMIAKGGASLLQQEATKALKEKLLPLATVVTPNIPEAEVLAGCQIRSLEDKKEAAKGLHALGADHVIIKGGHEDTEEVIDLLFDGHSFYDFKSERLATPNTHGTGCTFSAALTAELAKGASVFVATAIAKQFIQAAIKHDLGIGHGHGPTNHWAYRQFGRGSTDDTNLE
jgi:hydroxymethylpyrimidine/phosphomethylpyrimidine kinase